MSNPEVDNRAAIAEVLTADKKREHDTVKSQLDILRATRKSRGGVGAPLSVPAHLRSAANGHGIVITDADLKNDTPLPPSLFQVDEKVE